MSTTETKRPLAQALADAEAFRDLFDGCYEHWTIAGSCRRKRPEVADIEHVVIPKMGSVAVGGGLFAEEKEVNLLWHRCDALLGTEYQNHIYGASGPRWGQKYRGMDYRGFNHEIFTATPENLGSVLAIRTGPAEFSRRLVTGLLQRGMRNKDGSVWNCERCPEQHPRGANCPKCDGTGLVPVIAIKVIDEGTFFALCGVTWITPEKRMA